MSDQYTPIHNYVLEALSKVNLAPYETRVLLCIWRKTYGFVDKETGKRKKTDWISGSQITKMTGLDRRYVYRALQGLKRKNVITRDDNKTGFSKEFMKQMSLLKDEKEPQPQMSSKLSPPVIGTDDKMSSKLSHTKENKRNYTKEIYGDATKNNKKTGMQPLKSLLENKQIKVNKNTDSRISHEWQEKALRYAEVLHITLGQKARGRWFKAFKQASEGRNAANLEKALTFLIDYPTPMSNEQKMMFFFKIFENGTDWLKSYEKGGVR